ncbi:MAG TPA: CHASE3 domain-containing protein, partial [Bacteroidia bacterium]|nr:CHASE3 domain-containing protein [Bacteroidia bacterium]
MEKNSHTRIKFVFFCAVVFLLALSVFSFIRIKKLIDISRWVNHTNEVKLKLADVFSTLTEMEANQRGYIITDDSVFLDTYYKKGPLLAHYLDDIDSLTSDNAVQQINAKQLHALINERKDYMQLVLNDTAAPDIRIKHMIVGRALMDDVRKCIATMKDKEDTLLDKRTLVYNEESTLTPRVSFFLILSAILIVIAAYYKIIKDLRNADILKHELAKTNEELKIKNQQLKKNEERFFKMFDNNPVALSFGEIGSNKIAFANKLFYSYFGYTPEEVIGHTSEELNLVSPEENARLLPLILSYLEENRSVEELRALPANEMEKLLIKLRENMFGNGFEVLYTRKNKETFY